MRMVLFVLGLALAAVPARADGLRDSLAGSWLSGGCGEAAVPNAAGITFEFALTGGQMTVDSGDEASGAHAVSISASGATLTATLDGKDKWVFRRDGAALVAVAPPALYSGLQGQKFPRCAPPFDRSAIHLDAKQTRAISGTMPGGPVLIDLRARKACAATVYQYLNFDLVGPAGYVLHRWNSYALGEKLADGGKAPFATDEISDFVVDKADAEPGGYRFAVTQMIPPNGSRGDTTTIHVRLDGKGTATIPEWKRRYAVCTHTAG